jgi:hypothetical protein
MKYIKFIVTDCNNWSGMTHDLCLYNKHILYKKIKNTFLVILNIRKPNWKKNGNSRGSLHEDFLSKAPNFPYARWRTGAKRGPNRSRQSLHLRRDQEGCC